MVPSKRLCPGGCKRPVDIDIHLQAGVSLRPFSDQTVPVQALLTKQQAQIS